MEEDWFFYSITLFTFIVIFGMCYIRHKFTFFERNKTACASNPTFPFGNIYDVVFKNTPMFMLLWKFHNKLKRRRCKLGGFYMYLKPTVLIVDPKMMGIFSSSNDEYFREAKERDGFSEQLKDKLLREILDSFLNSWPSMASISENIVGEEVNLSSIMNAYVAEISECQLLSLREPNQNCRLLVNHIREQSHFSSLCKLVGISIPGIFQISINKYKNTYKKLLESISQNRVKEDVKKNDVIQVLLDNHRSVIENADFLFDLIYNLQISINLVLFTFYELSLNKEIQEDLRGEILRFKKNRTITTLEDLNELSYLETVICETLRKYPLKPFAYKVCTKNFEQEDLKFSKDLLLFISVFGIHHDSQNYVNPELFDPDRFSEENKCFIDPVKYLPFGFGNKEDFDSKCVTMIMKLTIIELISKFKFSLSKRSSRSLTFDEGTFELRTKNEMWFKLEKV